jgi:hypothetical protein
MGNLRKGRQPLMRRIRIGVSYILGKNIGGRFFVPRKEQIALVSYPKSGNTWLRAIIANLLSGKDLSLNAVEVSVPDIYKKRVSYLNRNMTPFFKSHEYYTPSYNKVVYLVRDPRDIIGSYYSYQKKLKQIPDDIECIEQYMSLFLSGDNSSYGDWASHVNSWLEIENLILIKYEDLKTAPISVLKKICDFSNIRVDDAEIKKALTACTIERMKDKEHGWDEMKGASESGFFRNGNVGGYKSEISVDAVQKLEKQWAKVMKKLDYL